MRPRAAIVLAAVLALLGGAALLLLRSPGGDGAQRPEPSGGTRPVAPSPAAPASTPDPTQTPITTADSVERLKADVVGEASRTAAGLKALFQRARTLGPAADPVAKDLAARIVRDADEDDADARAALGHQRFAHAMPEIISFRKYDYLRVVEDAIRQRWFDNAADFALAEAAWKKTVAHARRLQYDPTFRALDGARREVALARDLRDYNVAAAFASPYLVCYASNERVTEGELSELPSQARQRRIDELAASRARLAMRLAEKATILQQLYREFLRRYGEACDLRDLLSPYGGRPDLALGKRSFKDGCPLVVVVFEDRRAWDEFHSVVRGEPVNPAVHGFFSPHTGWAYLYDDDENRASEVDRTLEVGVQQLLHWFQRQKREWGHPVVPETFFENGFADYLGAARMAPDRSLAFQGVNRSRLAYGKARLEDSTAESRKLPVFPLAKLASFESYDAVAAWGVDHRVVRPVALFFAQSWAFIDFLNEFEDRKYQAKFTRFVKDMLVAPKSFDEKPEHRGYTFDRLAIQLGLRSDSDWERLEKEFGGWYLDTLLRMDPEKIGPSMPARDEWPGYVPAPPIDPLAATDPLKPDPVPSGELTREPIEAAARAVDAFRARAEHRIAVDGSHGTASDVAVENALRWLAAHQSSDGRWECEGFAAWCDGKGGLRDGPAGAGKAAYDVGVTGLSLLAFLGAGYTSRSEGPFGRVVASGLRYLRNLQDAEGCFGSRATGHYVYNHAIATLAMVEAHAMTRSAGVHDSAQAALDLIALARNPYFAWRYGIKPGDNDTSVTGWMTMALHTARLVNDEDVRAGRPPSFTLDEKAFDGVHAWVEKVTDPDSGRGGYQQRGTGSARPTELVDRFPGDKTESMTAVGVLARLLLGEDPTTSEPVRKGAALCSALPPNWNASDGSIDMYYWYYSTSALVHVGGDAWTKWEAALKTHVVERQRTDSDFCAYRGSWDNLDPWGPDGGRVYSTAILALTLETPYRSARLVTRERPR